MFGSFFLLLFAGSNNRGGSPNIEPISGLFQTHHIKEYSKSFIVGQTSKDGESHERMACHTKKNVIYICNGLS